MNLIKVLEKEIEKGNSIITHDGNTLSEEKFTQSLKKEYLKLARDGVLDIERVPFERFASDKIGNTLPTQEVINFLGNVLNCEAKAE